MAKVACPRCAAGKPCEFTHGGCSGYTRHGCRCEPCRDWKRIKNLRTREGCSRCKAGEPCAFKHGSKVGYEYHSCKCGVCRAGNAARKAARRQSDPHRKEKANAYYAAHREKLREQDRLRRAANPEHYIQKERDYRAANHDRVIGWSRASYRRHHTEIQAKRRREYPAKAPELRRRRRELYYADPAAVERRRQAQREYYDRNRDYLAEQARARHARTRLRVTTSQRNPLRPSVPTPRAFDPWTPTEEAIALRNDVTITEICYMLGRSYASVCLRRSLLRKKMAAAS